MMVHLAVSRAILRKRKGRRGRLARKLSCLRKLIVALLGENSNLREMTIHITVYIYLTNQSIKVYTSRVKPINQALK